MAGTIAYELTVDGSAQLSGAAEAWWHDVVLPVIRGAEGIVSAELFRPTAGEGVDPYNPEKHPPLLRLTVDCADRAGLDRFAGSAAWRTAIDTVPEGIALASSAMERRAYPVPDGNGTGERANVANIVRYRHPMDDPAGFVDEYLSQHPQIEAAFPGIRDIFCFIPIDWADPTGVTDAGYVLGNEVGFDSAAAFGQAMASPAREELRAHFRTFPPLRGRLSHDLMERQMIVSAAV
mgnify:CR=1 FL=1